MLYNKLVRAKHSRDDGWLCELVSMNYGDEPFDCVHSYLVSIEPGRTRANHYHKAKEEWLGVVCGKVILSLKDVCSQEVDGIYLDAESDDYKLIYIPPLVAHAVKNVSGNKAKIIVFSKNPENKEDTIPCEV